MGVHKLLTNWRKSTIRLLIGLLLLATVLGGCETFAPTATPVPFKDSSFKVSSGSEYRVTLGMTAGSKLEFNFRSDLDINVRLLDPTGDSLGSWDRVDRLNGISTTAETEGVYILVFDNSFSILTSKAVDLNYRVVPSSGR